MWLAAVGFVVAVFVAVSLWLAQARRLQLKTWLGSAVLVAWVVGVGVKLHFDQTKDESTPVAAASALPSIAWPSSNAGAAPAIAPQLISAQPAAAGAKEEVAPVASLVDGLKQRLAAQPDDPNGWALLAQSYAFMGNMEEAEKAVKKAVSLGIDEKALRARVEGAKRNPHTAAQGGATVGG